jgi:hypothetical protein
MESRGLGALATLAPQRQELAAVAAAASAERADQVVVAATVAVVVARVAVFATKNFQKRSEIQHFDPVFSCFCYLQAFAKVPPRCLSQKSLALSGTINWMQK